MTRTLAAVLPASVRRAIVAHARREDPRECCGFLIGAGREVRHAIPARNLADSPVRFRIDDALHLSLRRALRGAVPPLGIVGIYHSHPASAPEPSSSDLAEAWYPDWLYLIAGRPASRWDIRGFYLRDGRARRVRLVAGV